MVDYSIITERVYTGAAISSKEDVDQLVAAGVTHIIDNRSEFDDASIIMASHPEVLYLWNPQNDDGVHPKPVEWFKKAIDFSLPAIITPGKVIYSHCAAGVNRGPSIAFTILRVLGITHMEAVSLLRFHRPQVGLAYADDAELALKQLGWVK